jgi:hypothetical protein
MLFQQSGCVVHVVLAFSEGLGKPQAGYQDGDASDTGRVQNPGLPVIPTIDPRTFLFKTKPCGGLFQLIGWQQAYGAGGRASV